MRWIGISIGPWTTKSQCRSDRIRITRRKSASACALARLEVRLRSEGRWERDLPSTWCTPRSGCRRDAVANDRSTTEQDHVDVDVMAQIRDGLDDERRANRTKRRQDGPIDGSCDRWKADGSERDDVDQDAPRPRLDVEKKEEKTS